MNGFLIFLICAVVLVLGVLSKRLTLSCGLILLPLAVFIYLVMGKATFFLAGCSIAICYLFALLLKFFSKSAYKLIYCEKSPLLSLSAYTGLLFCELFILALCISTYEGMYTDYGFLRLAFYTTLATSSALALSTCVNGFASNGINIMTNKKTTPFEVGSITILGAVSAFFACFATALIYFFISKSAVQASLTCLLSFIGYIVNAMICAKFQNRTVIVSSAPSIEEQTAPSTQETEQVKETVEQAENEPKQDDNSVIPQETTEIKEEPNPLETVKTEDKPLETIESNALTLSFISILLPTIIAVIIGLILK